MKAHGLTYAEQVSRVAADLRLLMPWLPPHQAAAYAARFVENGAYS